MAGSLGSIYVELKLDDREFRSGLSRIKSETEKTISGIEATQKSSDEATLAFKKRMNQQRLAEEEKFHKANRSYIEKTMESSKNILAAAPGFAIATAAISGVYVALRGVRDEFTGGLAAVEDYQLKVASMSAFLTTFDKNLTSTNASTIYDKAKIEAQNLVQTMEILDARTIATGKDLTTMAEQFIKGGIKIDTTNKASLDGFVNIANALKLLTQGQNQEIQMRQEIRALSQGQVRDQNILVQTLKGIDPQIKEHIKLWKQQGTVLENVGQLLAGFGPAAQDLENTWAVIGSTMETIHTRILRGMFKPTYDSLVQTAKEWNRNLMDSEGFLTPTAQMIIDVGKSSLDFLKNIVNWGAELGKIALIAGPIFVAIEYGVSIIETLTLGTMLAQDAMIAFTAATLLNPIFIAAAAAAAIYGIMKIKDSISETTQETIKATQSTKDYYDKIEAIYQTSNGLDEVKAKMKALNDEVSSQANLDSWAAMIERISGVKPDLSWVSNLRKELNKEPEKGSWLDIFNKFLLSTGGGEVPRGRETREKSEALAKNFNLSSYQGPLSSGTMTSSAPSDFLNRSNFSTSNILGNKEENFLSSSDVANITKDSGMDSYLKQLQKQSEKIKDSARATLELKIATGEFATEVKEMNGGGELASNTLNKWIADARKAADTIDSNKLGEKSKQQWDSASKSIEGTITSLHSMNLEQEKSQEAIWRSKFASDSYRKELGMSVEQFDRFKKAYEGMVTEEAKGADSRKELNKANSDADKYYDNLKTKLESLEGAPGETEQLLNWGNAFEEAMFKAGSSATVTAAQLDEIYTKLDKFDEMMGKAKSITGEKAIGDLQKGMAKWKVTNLPGSKEENKENRVLIDLEQWKKSWDKMTDIQKEASGISAEMWAEYYETISTMNDNWVMGAQSGLDTYANSTTNAFKTAGASVEKAFKGMEDALVNFVKTGKLDFSSMIDSMITDLIRFQIQQSITSPLAENSSSLLGTLGGAIAGMFGGGGGITSAAAPNTSYVGSYDSMVGTSSSFSMASAAGGYDIPAGTNPVTQLHEREMVLPADIANRFRGSNSESASGGTMSVIVNNFGSEKVETKEGKTASGGKSLTIQIGEAVAGDIKSGGPVARALKDTFGMKPQLAMR